MFSTRDPQWSGNASSSDSSISTGWKTRKTLIERIAGSCEQSWQEFFLFYRGFVATIASKNGVGSADLDDVTQSIFLEVHKDFTASKQPEFHDRSFGAWLGQKVKWRVVEYHRHRHRREHATDPADLVSHGANRPFDELWAREWRRKTVELAMSRLQEKPRNLMIFQALTIHEIPVEQVCKQFKITRTNADTIKKRVKDKLAPIIREIDSGLI